MSNKVWRPLNTWGIYLLGTATGFVVVYNIVELTRACSSL